MGVARVAQDVSQVCSGADLESLAGELLKIIAAELIQGCPEVARELLGRVARESCSGELLGSVAWGLLQGSAAGVGPGFPGS